MIKYDRFWVTMKERGITQYDLYEHYQITRSLLDRLRKNKNVEIYTIDRLCSILHCEIEDIVEHIEEELSEGISEEELHIFYKVLDWNTFPSLTKGTNIQKKLQRKTILTLKIRKTLSDCDQMQLFC